MPRARFLIESNDQKYYLEQAFPMIALQSDPNFGIIFLYSGHEQTSVQLAQQRNIRVTPVDPRKFSLGKALIDGAANAHSQSLATFGGASVPTRRVRLSTTVNIILDDGSSQLESLFPRSVNDYPSKVRS